MCGVLLLGKSLGGKYVPLMLLAAVIADRRRTEESLRDTSGKLINAQEQERSRLAAEIHDDFSQRLALLALGLEKAEEAISSSPVEALKQVHSLLNSASEIGADLHTLSHRLHSSTLEALGLVPGVAAFCKEFASQQGIEIDFLPDDIPRSTHPDVALRLFRVVQEGLRNLKKHSGAPKAQVRLHRAGDRLLVSVSDERRRIRCPAAGEKRRPGHPQHGRAFILVGRAIRDSFQTWEGH
jgi:signal transduction histidine kinase